MQERIIHTAAVALRSLDRPAVKVSLLSMFGKIVTTTHVSLLHLRLNPLTFAFPAVSCHSFLNILQSRGFHFDDLIVQEPRHSLVENTLAFGKFSLFSLS